MDAEGLLQLIRSRRSIRQFGQRRLDQCEIELIVVAARWAPSNHNRQGWKFVVFQNPQEIRDLAQSIRTCLTGMLTDAHRLAMAHSGELIEAATAFESAPTVILAMHKKCPALGGELSDRATSELAFGEALSTAMAVENMLLAAHAMGLGACVMTAPLLAGDVWRSLPDLPAGFEPTCVIALGDPAEHPEAPRRKDLKHIIEYR